MRNTRQPAARKVRFTFRSRAWFAASFLRQNAALFRGFVACNGQACQKQPSTNTASRSLGKTKSGRTEKMRFADCGLRDELDGTRLARRFRVPRSAFRISRCLLQPVMPCRRKSAASASSVSRFPRERIRAITSERFALVKTSAINQLLYAGGSSR